MDKLSPQLKQKLLAFGHRRLKKGEIYLLAHAIANQLSIGKAMPENIRIHSLNQRDKIDRAIYGLTDYIYLNADDIARLYTIIDGVLLWRVTVAFSPAPLVFTGEANNVVDECTGILRYVDVSDICAVSDIAATASYTAAIFQEYVQNVE